MGGREALQDGRESVCDQAASGAGDDDWGYGGGLAAMGGRGCAEDWDGFVRATITSGGGWQRRQGGLVEGQMELWVFNREAEVVEGVGQASGAWGVEGLGEAKAVEAVGVGLYGRGSLSRWVDEVEEVVPGGRGVLMARASLPGIV